MLSRNHFNILVAMISILTEMALTKTSREANLGGQTILHTMSVPSDPNEQKGKYTFLNGMPINALAKTERISSIQIISQIRG